MNESNDHEHATVFEYLYRDAGNYKTYGALLLTGRMPDAEARLRACLESQTYFVAEQVGIPALCAQHWIDVGDGPSDLDHAYHEFVALRDATPEDLVLPRGGCVEALLHVMQRAAGCWDVRLSPNCDL